mmetsp:Transcript_27168/g.68935  ORF Transcript_27168/g.68935 Transcript_27168/m.68935 type:complete len:555 (-) Transcript_27168:48-1712(-)
MSLQAQLRPPAVVVHHPGHASDEASVVSVPSLRQVSLVKQLPLRVGALAVPDSCTPFHHVVMPLHHASTWAKLSMDTEAALPQAPLTPGATPHSSFEGPTWASASSESLLKEHALPRGGQHVSPTYRWLLVALMSLEILAATGIVFGWSALALALRRDRVYFDLCEDQSAEGDCDKVEFQYSMIYSAGAIAAVSGFTIWGFVLDWRGSVFVRLCGLVLLVAGSLLFAFSDDRSFDAYLPAMVLMGSGGTGFFMSHFVIAQHFRYDHFGLVHALLNSFFDASTITFTIFEMLHRAGVSIRALFIGIATLCAMFAVLSSRCTWRGMLQPPPKVDEQREEDKREDKLLGPGMDASRCSARKQILIPHFWLANFWMLIQAFPIMFMFATIRMQMVHNAGGKSQSEADDLVRLFNWLILISAIITPLFGRLMDRCGIAAGFALVNCLGMFCFGAIHASDYTLLYLAFVAFGCFRAWHYGSCTAYTQGVFGGASFGRIYGLIQLWGIVASALQAPIIMLCLEQMSAWGDFLPINMSIEVASALAFAFPIYIVWQGRRAPP